MDLNYVRKLVKLLSESSLSELEIEEDGRKIRLAKQPVASPELRQNLPAPAPVPAAAPVPALTVPAPAPAAAAAPPPPPESDRYHQVKSPIVGTFYRAPAPDAAPFVQVGSSIAPGTVLCIVEAMKLMNEIESDVSGKIVKVLVENGQPVEYDQTLFLVDPT